MNKKKPGLFAVAGTLLLLVGWFTFHRIVSNGIDPQLLAKANGGDPVAQSEISEMYVSGKDVREDHVLAANWCRKAANQGYPVAERNLGLMYEGGFGVAKDHAQSILWMTKAADQSDAVAQDMLGSASWNAGDLTTVLSGFKRPQIRAIRIQRCRLV